MGLNDADRNELTDLSYRYASMVDGRQFDEMADLFAPDATLITPTAHLDGRNEILTAMRALVRYDSTFHLVGQTRHWEVNGTTNGETYCVAHHFVAEPEATRDRVMYIRYHDELVHDDRWRFARRELEVIWAGQEDKTAPSSTA